MSTTKTVANRTIKARSKGTPDRIQKDIVSAKAIVEKRIVDNTIHHVAETEALSMANLPQGDISVPMSLWLEHKAELKTRDSLVAVQIAADQFPEDFSDEYSQISCIVLPVVTHVDGRSYSHAYKLRTRFNYRGEIRAIGDVKYDQLGFLARAGCNAFELPEGENLETALKAFTEMSDVYQPSSDSGALIFSRRRAIH
ncbi:MAG: hypothetical protein ACJAQ6_000164 [Arenicella sp.]|jgi:uncharacterized protein (DUF934 family)